MIANVMPTPSPIARGLAEFGVGTELELEL